MIPVLKSLFYFILAGFCEIGGGYLIWLWLRESRGAMAGAAGAVLLMVYGIIPTLQPAPFGRVYAAYGGIFVLLSLFWGWKIDGVRPDRLDFWGAVLVLVGVLIMMYGPRRV
jgi:small multidrug resistance family-3 protein